MTIGDFSVTRVDGTFRLVYVVFNTIWNLTTQDAQVDCFRTAAAHLEPGGCFVVELSVPSLQRLPPGERFQPFAVDATHLGIDEWDLTTQALTSHHFRAGSDGRFERFSCPGRYAWPAELDLMARLAGMTPARALGRLEPGAVHQRKPVARLRVGEAHVAIAPAAPPGHSRGSSFQEPGGAVAFGLLPVVWQAPVAQVLP